ncbi:MAG: nucleotidyltransferase domain-containing protein [Rhizobiales bacterium]|nr:nucleotidyltransferase domain-containing protein [Hyphomicrobiales bacterium]
MRRDEAIARLRAAEPEIRARGVGGLYLFGSVARDAGEAHSDIDVFVDPDPTRRFGFGEFMAVYELLQERLGAKVDYTTREGLHRRLRPEIKNMAVRVL